MQVIHLRTYSMKSAKSHIICIKQKKLVKKIQQYNAFNKVVKQNGCYIYELDLKRKDKYVALSSLSIYYAWKNRKKSYKKNNFNQLPRGMKDSNYQTDHILY